MSVLPLNPEDRDNAARAVCEAEDCGHHEGDAPHCAGCMAYATHMLAALEASGWTLLPPGTARVEHANVVVDEFPHFRERQRVVGPWTPKEPT